MRPLRQVKMRPCQIAKTKGCLQILSPDPPQVENRPDQQRLRPHGNGALHKICAALKVSSSHSACFLPFPTIDLSLPFPSIPRSIYLQSCIQHPPSDARLLRRIPHQPIHHSHPPIPPQRNTFHRIPLLLFHLRRTFRPHAALTHHHNPLKSPPPL